MRCISAPQCWMLPLQPCGCQSLNCSIALSIWCFSWSPTSLSHMTCMDLPLNKLFYITFCGHLSQNISISCVLKKRIIMKSQKKKNPGVFNAWCWQHCKGPCKIKFAFFYTHCCFSTQVFAYFFLSLVCLNLTSFYI